MNINTKKIANWQRGAAVGLAFGLAVSVVAALLQPFSANFYLFIKFIVSALLAVNPVMLIYRDVPVEELSGASMGIRFYLFIIIQWVSVGIILGYLSRFRTTFFILVAALLLVGIFVVGPLFAMTRAF